MKIVYIASSAHSGSTLLDLMLNAHSKLVTVGEIKQLPRFTTLDKVHKRCTCGAPTILECPFWTRVDALVRERSGGRTLSDLGIDAYNDPEVFQTDNRLLFDAVEAISGASIIVDSSKETKRLEMLLATPGLDVLPIFLVRNPKGQILSVSRSSERKQRENPAGLAGMIGAYTRQNIDIARIVRHRPHFLIRYEELVREPTELLTALMHKIGVEYEPQQRDFAEHERHNVGGNRMRRRFTNVLRLDEAWRRDLSFFQKLAIDIGTLPGRSAFRKLEAEAGK